MTIRLPLALLFVCALLTAQRRVDPRNMYERVLAVVPMVGSGTASDPVRPDYAPVPANPAVTPGPAVASAATSGATPPLRQGIIAFSYVVSDDGKLALVEFVAVDRGAFKDLLADLRLNVKAFLKGRDKREDIETEFKKHKKDFSLDQLGAIVP